MEEKWTELVSTLESKVSGKCTARAACSTRKIAEAEQKVAQIKVEILAYMAETVNELLASRDLITSSPANRAALEAIIKEQTERLQNQVETQDRFINARFRIMNGTVNAIRESSDVNRNRMDVSNRIFNLIIYTFYFYILIICLPICDLNILIFIR